MHRALNCAAASRKWRAAIVGAVLPSTRARGELLRQGAREWIRAIDDEREWIRAIDDERECKDDNDDGSSGGEAAVEL